LWAASPSSFIIPSVFMGWFQHFSGFSYVEYSFRVSALSFHLWVETQNSRSVGVKTLVKILWWWKWSIIEERFKSNLILLAAQCWVRVEVPGFKDWLSLNMLSGHGYRTSRGGDRWEWNKVEWLVKENWRNLKQNMFCYHFICHECCIK
jgi:hypothetical protein